MPKWEGGTGSARVALVVPGTVPFIWKMFALPGSKKSHFLGKSRAARARKPDPYLKNQDFV